MDALPVIASPTAAELAAAQKDVDPTAPSSVVYVGHIPHGFFERAMLKFFRQFGRVKRLRVARNPKTGKSRHHAFIEFALPAVAAIVAKTMDNYFMFDKYLKAEVLPQGKVHEALFMGSGKKIRVVPWAMINRKNHNKPKSYLQQVSRREKLIKKDEAKRKKLQEAGIDYEFSGYAASGSVPTLARIVEDAGAIAAQAAGVSAGDEGDEDMDVSVAAKGKGKGKKASGKAKGSPKAKADAKKEDKKSPKKRGRSVEPAAAVTPVATPKSTKKNKTKKAKATTPTPTPATAPSPSASASPAPAITPAAASTKKNKKSKSKSPKPVATPEPAAAPTPIPATAPVTRKSKRGKVPATPAASVTPAKAATAIKPTKKGSKPRGVASTISPRRTRSRAKKQE